MTDSGRQYSGIELLEHQPHPFGKQAHAGAEETEHRHHQQQSSGEEHFVEHGVRRGGRIKPSPQCRREIPEGSQPEPLSINADWIARHPSDQKRSEPG